MRLERVLPYVIAALMLSAEAVLIVLGWGPWSPEGTPSVFFWMAVAGGPVCLLLALVIAPLWPRHAGAILWLGGATLALGIGLGSGIHVGRYFLGLGLFVLPEVLAASLFLALGRRRADASGRSKASR